MDKRTELALKIYDFIENQLKEAIEDTSEYLRCVKWDENYDEDKLYEDAVERVIDDLENGNFSWKDVYSDCDFIDLMKQIVKDIRNEN